MGRATYGEGSVRNVGTNRWELRWSDGRDPFTGKLNRRSVTVSAPNITEARRELRKRSVSRLSPSRLTLGDLLDATLPTLPISEITRATYGYALAHLPEPARVTPVDRISIVSARHVMEGLIAACGPQTVRKCHGAIMACWRQATLNGWVTENPWRGQRLPKIPATAGRALTDPEVSALRAACTPVELLWIDVHLETGARPGEVVGIRWSDIDHDDLTITVTDTKHKNTRRPIAIGGQLSAAIRARQQDVRLAAFEVGARLVADPWLFAMEPDGSRPWTVNYAGSFRWPRLRARAGLDADLRLYDARHTANSWLAAGGIDATTRAARIGNSPATNERVYSHPLNDRAAAEVTAARLRAT